MKRWHSIVCAVMSVAASLPAMGAPSETTPTQSDQAITSVTFNYSDARGIGPEPGVCRRDPSDVISVGDTYYLYYTKVVRDALPKMFRRLYPSGYPGTVWYAASSDEGRTWTERGQALGLGSDEAFDSFGVFTPNILRHGGKYYLYYTGVRPTPTRDDGVFENNNTSDITALGLAVADAPTGPFRRVSDKPILEVSNERERFDSYRVDDACLLVRGDQVWLYYKGRSRRPGGGGPGRTCMGLAIATSPAGPYVRQNDGNPLQDSGHEVMIWRRGGGVMSLVSPVGPQGRSLQYADDGRAFRVLAGNLKKQPTAPGLYRPELADPAAARSGTTWGISMVLAGDHYLRRFEIKTK